MPLFTVLLGTGGRIGEILGLRWEDCDFQGNIININHTLIYRKYTDEASHFAITTPKTKSGVRIIPMLSDVKAALTEEYKEQLESGFNESVVDGYSGFIFKSRYNTVLSPHCVNRAIDRIIKACNAKEKEEAKAEGREPELLPHLTVIAVTGATYYLYREFSLFCNAEVTAYPIRWLKSSELKS